MPKCKHRINIENNIFCRKHNKFIDQPYKCSKSYCKDCHFPTLAIITIPVGRCDECPFCYTDYTRGVGCADDYFCKAAKNKKIVGYVEYEQEIPPVPDWCPFYIVKEGV